MPGPSYNNGCVRLQDGAWSSEEIKLANILSLDLPPLELGENTYPILKHLAYVTLLWHPSWKTVRNGEEPEIIKMQVVGYELPTANALYAVCIYRKELKNQSKEENPEQPIQINQGAMWATVTQKL